MEFAPPPAPGSRIQELGDRLIVRFRPYRSWGRIAFLAVWLTLWTGAGFGAFDALQGETAGDFAFLALWLCGWAGGECVVIALLAWQFFGRELLIVTPTHLEVRRELRRFVRAKSYDVDHVEGIAAAQVPVDEDDTPRKDFCLEVSWSAKTLHVGEGMGEREAEYVASSVLSWIRPGTPSTGLYHQDVWQFVHEAADERLPEAAQPARSSRPSTSRRVPPAAVMAALGAVAIFGASKLVFRAVEPLDPPSRTSPAPRLPGPPSPQEFSDPREYASAMTRFSLASSRTKILARPRCAAHMTWTRWTCSVEARAADGPFAGRTLVYRCTGSYREGPGAPAVGGTLCGLEHPPPIDPA